MTIRKVNRMFNYIDLMMKNYPDRHKNYLFSLIKSNILVQFTEKGKACCKENGIDLSCIEDEFGYYAISTRILFDLYKIAVKNNTNTFITDLIDEEILIDGSMLREINSGEKLSEVENNKRYIFNLNQSGLFIMFTKEGKEFCESIGLQLNDNCKIVGYNDRFTKDLFTIFKFAIMGNSSVCINNLIEDNVVVNDAYLQEKEIPFVKYKSTNVC